MASLLDEIVLVLTTQDPAEKADAARRLVSAWRDGKMDLDARVRTLPWPDPASRERPALASPGSMPKRGLGSQAGRTALLHAVCHIELNAIDLALDMAGRFGPTMAKADQHDFITDWLGVADDEARHFNLLSDRLSAMGAAYGDLPAHGGLWDAARRTSHDVMARLAIAPMVLEARGLDVTPGMIARLIRVGDTDSAAALQLIYDEEIGHVATGTKWFRHLCAQQAQAPDTLFEHLVGEHFPGGLKAPFNHEGREQSDFPRDWYEGLG